MKRPVIQLATLICLLLFPIAILAQEDSKKSDFWERVQFGGGIGAAFGTGYSDVTVAPGAIYNFNRYFAAGVGLQGSYIRFRGAYESYIYGGSLLALASPIEEIQLSAELEQVRVNSEYVVEGGTIADDFWNTALFMGAGFRTGNVTIGIRYNVLHNDDNPIYRDPYMPFIRVFF